MHKAWWQPKNIREKRGIILDSNGKQLFLSVRQGDITSDKVDAIVNSANKMLYLGSGVAGAILRAGGGTIQEECDKIIDSRGGETFPPGSAIETSAGTMYAKKVIHAVGPIWNGGTEDEEFYLSKVMMSVLMKATELGISSLSIPGISSGAFGFPKESCAKIIIETIENCVENMESLTVSEIHLINMDAASVYAFENEFINKYGEDTHSRETKEDTPIFKLGKKEAADDLSPEEEEMMAQLTTQVTPSGGIILPQ